MSMEKCGHFVVVENTHVFMSGLVSQLNDLLSEGLPLIFYSFCVDILLQCQRICFTTDVLTDTVTGQVHYPSLALSFSF